MIPRSGNIATQAFIKGLAKSTPNTVSTGNALFLFGNKIAEYRKDGLYISNGGYTVYTRNGHEVIASSTTKTRLNDLPGVRIGQANNKIYLNGVEWDGSWIKIEGVEVPEIDTKNIGNIFSKETYYVRIDGWRGFNEYKYAVLGWSDTGMYSDSPCKTEDGNNERDQIKVLLHAAGIKTQELISETSNVFCVHHSLIVKIKDFEQAQKIVQAFLDANDTRLVYLPKPDKAA